MDNTTWTVIGILALIILCLLAGVAGLDYLDCNIRTADIGFPSRFNVLSGCFIEVEPGKWIPLDAYYYKEP